MAQQQGLILAILAITVALFLSGRWRHDVVAGIALMATMLCGLITPQQAFSGLAHPAVVTVACVLILSAALQRTGAVDALTRRVMPAKAGRNISILTLVSLGAALSAFMNNVGAMALLMPVAIQLARRLELSAGQVLMPLAFGTILGGMTTLIGTPPNLIVSGFRNDSATATFNMFDFSLVGIPVALAGIMLVSLLGRYLVPARKTPNGDGFESGAYITEVRVNSNSKVAGKSILQIEREAAEIDAQIIGLVRKDIRLIAANPHRKVLADDILLIEAEAAALTELLALFDLTLEEAVDLNSKDASDEQEASAKDTSADDNNTNDNNAEITLGELVVLPGSPLSGRSASDLMLRTRYGLNLLALSRQGQQSVKRLRKVALRSGDLLLLQGPAEAIAEFAADNNCVPLAERELRIPNRKKAWQAGGIMLGAIVCSATGLLPAAVAFSLAVLVSMLLQTLPVSSVYQAIDWPVIMLLAALLPVAGAMASTGAADLIAVFLLQNLAQDSAIIALVLILLITMLLSDVMNNAATAAVMCPIAISTATALQVNADTFLMAVAIGASCAFLTPIGHQNNTLILGPGGFRFGDYWRLGLPLELLITVLAIPLLLLAWPL
ncbi:SLC13 family permease [Rheinheimera fenheensis]|uniref:SLC13 family permease n=1 Tax=Rheinheimera fenheensis TaxID=3152295 RepID=UPI00325E7E8C